jgi:MFS family permease
MADMWQELEQGFNRALYFSLTRKKIFFILPILLICGLIVVLSHTLWVGANPWIRSSLAFIPGFLCMALFLAAAVPLIRLYHDEVKQKPLSINKTLHHSWRLMAGIGSLIVPMLTAYLVLWFILGMFYLLKNIPATGELLGGFLSFGPFLLIAGSLVLIAIALALVFFLSPVVALKSTMSWELAEEVLKGFGKAPFLHFILLLLGLLPLLIAIGFLILAATLTGMTYFVTERTWAIGVQWFVIMIPFAALLSPVVVFFFNFAGESFVILQKRLHRP